MNTNNLEILGYIYSIKNNKEHRAKTSAKYVYIGSTSLDINDRYNFHKMMANNQKNKPTSKFYRTFSEVGIENFRIKKIESISAILVTGTKEEKRRIIRQYKLQRERHYYELYKAKYNNKNTESDKYVFLNTIRPYITQEEKESYYKNNKSEILKKAKEWYKINKIEHIDNVLEYYEKNKQAKRDYQRAYAKAIRDNSAKITCCCGSSFSSLHTAFHAKTKKHISFISSK